MSKQIVILCDNLADNLTKAISECPHDKLFILTDEHTHHLCMPLVQHIPALNHA